MAKVARSSKTIKNINRLTVHRQRIHLQTNPGELDPSKDGAIANPALEYTLRQGGQFSQSGFFSNEGSAEVLLLGGCKTELQALGSQYELKPLCYLSPYDSFLGVQQRLRLLGYLNREANELWDLAIDKAILNFQSDNGLETNGILCDHTIQRIKEAHGE